MIKKRLLKDLPFSNLKKGAVMSAVNSGYEIDNGETIYESGGSSSRGTTCFDEKEKEILNVIWEDKEWFEDAVINHLSFEVERNKIVISFKHLDLGQAQNLAKGIKHQLINKWKEEGRTYIWNEFDIQTISIK